MSKSINCMLTDEQYKAIEKVAEVMRAEVNEIVVAALLQDIDGFELNGDRESELLHSLRIYSDGAEIPDIRL